MSKFNWDQIYKKRKQDNIWPWSEVVSLTQKYANLDLINKKYKVLELGCGTGPNILYFLKLNMSYYGVDQSQEAIQISKKRFPKLRKRLKISDFTKKIPFQEKFDLIIDRSSLTHNDEASIKDGLNLIFSKLKKKGTFIGIDWHSVNHSDYKTNNQNLFTIDKFTKTNFKIGQFQDAGVVHFSNYKQINKYFKKWKIIFLEEKIKHQKLPKKNFVIAAWNFVVKKK